MAGASPHSIHSFNSELGHRSATGHEPLSNLGSIHSHLHNHHFPLPQHHPPSQRPTTLNEFITWNHSPQGMYPSTLIGPGLNPSLLPQPQPQPLSNAAAASTDNPRKRKHNTPSGETSSIGGFGPLPSGGNGTEARSPSLSPSPSALSCRRNAAIDAWAFARPLMSDETPPDDQWPMSSEQYGPHKPRTPWFGCKLCSDFGCAACVLACCGFILTVPQGQVQGETMESISK